MPTINDELIRSMEEEVEKHNQEVYGGEMSSHNKETLRKMIIKEDEFEKKQITEEDRMSKWAGL